MDLATKKKILLLEDTQSERICGYDHVCSLGLNEGADSYSEEYLNTADVVEIYDSCWKQWSSFLKSIPSENNPFIYQGINLLICFKKRVLNTINHINLMIEFLNSIKKKYPGYEICVDNKPGDTERPFLSDILTSQSGDIKENVQSEKLSKTNKFGAVSAPKQKKKRPIADVLAPKEFHFGLSRKAEVAIFSDPEKSKALLGKVSGSKLHLFSDKISPKLSLTALKHGCSTHQINMSYANRAVYQDKAEKFITLLEQSALFSEIEINGIEMGELIKKRFIQLFRKELALVLYMTDSALRFMRRNESLVSVLLDEDMNPWKNAYCQAANLMGLRTYVECHGALGNKAGFLPLTANKIFVWGNSQKRKLAEWGLAEERMIVSGRTYYEAYRNLTKDKARIQIEKKIAINSNKPIVVIGLMVAALFRRRPFENMRRDILKDVLALAEYFPDVQFVLKAKHGNDENGKYARQWAAANDLKNRFFVVTELHPLKLIKASDLVITHNTTFLVDAFAMGRPVINYCEAKSMTVKEFKGEGHFVAANNFQELKDNMERMLNMDASEFNESEISRELCFNELNKTSSEVLAKELLGEKAECHVG